MEEAREQAMGGLHGNMGYLFSMFRSHVLKLFQVGKFAKTSSYGMVVVL